MLRILTFLCWTGLLVSATSQEAAQPAVQPLPPHQNVSVLPSVPLNPHNPAQNVTLQPSSLPDIAQPPKAEAPQPALPKKPATEAPTVPEKSAEVPASSVKPETTETQPTTASSSTTVTLSTSEVPATSTVDPQTTTAAPPANTTVDPQPTTTPAPAPSTPVPPPSTPVPPPSVGKWVVNDTGKVCIVAQMAMQFNVSYVDSNKTKSHLVFDLPTDNLTTLARGVCGTAEQNLTLSWAAPGNGSWNNLTVHFVKNDTDKKYTLHHLELSLPPEDFPKANLSEPMVLVLQEPAFSTVLNSSYRCVRQQKLGLKMAGSNETAAVVSLSDLQFQAFRAQNNTIFGLAKDCAFDTSDVVAIVVGVALAGLVVVVLIAYLVGHRRSQAQGYVSM